MTDRNNILKRNREYIKAKNKIKTQVENNRLQHLALTENLQTLFQPILKSQEDFKKILAIEPLPHKDPLNEYGGIKTIRYFSNPDLDLPKRFSPIVDDEGITFLSDNNEELVNRLRVILAAMKEGHRSDRQYNEVNGILKRLLEKKSITKKDYIKMSNKEQLFIITSNKPDIKLSLDYEYELDRNKQYELGLKYFSVYNSIRNINENNNQLKISTDNRVTFRTISLLPGSYEYVAINDYLSEYAGSVSGKNNIEFEGNLKSKTVKTGS
ncbi:hypothetical protein LOTGIDRAFT_165248 [Lottia gigantea]|uniref:Uncharacterized protein n=1 Tax=Lottia gigantea TaxID=225164 RepID=V4BJX1_LOTGI|nr:hypothetical protein LOTGIDRAFT_165248 [Lottia gigantea]ESO88829.1 hypothetical protein LOTGIDRAFT_165248 [Lottia gigantea]